MAEYPGRRPNMRTVETPTSPDRSWWVKIRVDAALLVRLVRMTLSYATAGRKIRTLYRRAETAGEYVWVDDLTETAQRLK
jgi:hypothetical protein